MAELLSDAREAYERWGNIAFEQDPEPVTAYIAALEAKLTAVEAERDAALRWKDEQSYVIGHNDGFGEALSQVRDDLKFPTMLRKMWSGGEVQAWLDERLSSTRWEGTERAARAETAEADLAKARESALLAQSVLVKGIDTNRLPALKSAVSYALSYLALISAPPAGKGEPK